MKKVVLILTFALATIVPAGRLHAQQAGGTKIAIINVGYVYSKYEKAKAAKAEMEAALKPYKDKGEAIKAELVKYGTALKENQAKMPAKDVEQYQNYLLAKKRELEDLQREATAAISKRQEQQVVTLYKELTAAVNGYVKANGIELVLGYGQQVEGDLFSLDNVQRMMSGMDLGCTTPLYLGAGVDISQPIADMLNHHYRQAGGGAVSGTPASLQKN